MSQSYDFFTRFARILNSGQARSVILCGNIYDLFWDGQAYVPLIPFLTRKSQTGGVSQIVYELNAPLRMGEQDRATLRDAWVEWKSGLEPGLLGLQDVQRKQSRLELLQRNFDQHLAEANGNPTVALEFLRQLCVCSRAVGRLHLLIVVEGADMLLPAGNGDLASLNDQQLRRISIVQDWFGDPAFVAANDSVCLIAESRSLVHPRVARLPQVLAVDIPAPGADERRHFIEQFGQGSEERTELWSTPAALADFCAGLSNHALRQLLVGASYAGEQLTPEHVVGKVEEFIQAQLGEDVVEFTKPKHTLADVVGFARLKEFLRQELIPRFQAKGDQSLTGAAVAGPIGGGKTFIFEAVAAELDLPVLVMKNVRSQWYGQTDVIFERLRRVLEALEKVVIFVDEADTQFGRLDATAHETERRLTGRIQAMMSDPRLRGRVMWLLMTARIHLLSPDIRRPGRVGDLIIPVLDPLEDDRREFIRWVLKAARLDGLEGQPDALAGLVALLDKEVLEPDYSAAAFASLRSQVKALRPQTRDQLLALIRDLIPPEIGLARRYQTLQALLNCTRRSLLPDPHVTAATRRQWELEIRELERQGIS